VGGTGVVWAAQLLVPWWQALASQAGRFRRCSRLAGDGHCKPRASWARKHSPRRRAQL